MFTYVGLVRLTEEGQEKLHEAPKYLDKLRAIIEEEGGQLEDVSRIGMLEVVKTETFPAEKVDVFFKALA